MYLPQNSFNQYGVQTQFNSTYPVQSNGGMMNNFTPPTGNIVQQVSQNFTAPPTANIVQQVSQNFTAPPTANIVQQVPQNFTASPTANIVQQVPQNFTAPPTANIVQQVPQNFTAPPTANIEQQVPQNFTAPPTANIVQQVPQNFTAPPTANIEQQVPQNFWANGSLNTVTPTHSRSSQQPNFHLSAQPNQFQQVSQVYYKQNITNTYGYCAAYPNNAYPTTANMTSNTAYMNTTNSTNFALNHTPVQAPQLSNPYSIFSSCRFQMVPTDQFKNIQRNSNPQPTNCYMPMNGTYQPPMNNHTHISYDQPQFQSLLPPVENFYNNTSSYGDKTHYQSENSQMSLQNNLHHQSTYNTENHLNNQSTCNTENHLNHTSASINSSSISQNDKIDIDIDALLADTESHLTNSSLGIDLEDFFSFDSTDPVDQVKYEEIEDLKSVSSSLNSDKVLTNPPHRIDINDSLNFGSSVSANQVKDEQTENKKIEDDKSVTRSENSKPVIIKPVLRMELEPFLKFKLKPSADSKVKNKKIKSNKSGQKNTENGQVINSLESIPKFKVSHLKSEVTSKIISYDDIKPKIIRNVGVKPKILSNVELKPKVRIIKKPIQRKRNTQIHIQPFPTNMVITKVFRMPELKNENLINLQKGIIENVNTGTKTTQPLRARTVPNILKNSSARDKNQKSNNVGNKENIQQEVRNKTQNPIIIMID